MTKQDIKHWVTNLGTGDVVQVGIITLEVKLVKAHRVHIILGVPADIKITKKPKVVE